LPKTDKRGSAPRLTSLKRAEVRQLERWGESMSGWWTLRVATLGVIGGLISSQAFADETPTPEQQAAALANVPKDAQQY
jgi:hypothetical protein